MVKMQIYMTRLSVLPKNFIVGDKINVQCPQSIAGPGAVAYIEGTDGENIRKQMQMSWDNVSLNPNSVEHLEIVCVKWRINAALVEHC